MRTSARVRVAALGATAALAVALLPAVSAGATGSAPGGPTPPRSRTVDDVARAWRAQAPAAILVGRSVRGRTIVATRQGPATAPYVLLVLGQMHGSEPRGRDVVAALRRLPPPEQVQVWTITSVNPDGAARGSRTNAHGVDLNRNFPYLWSARYTDRTSFWPGPRAASEPETRATMAFLDQLRPDLLVSLHQHFNAVDTGNGRTRVWALRLAAALHLRTLSVPCSAGPCTGTMTMWFNHGHPGTAITVELPAAVTGVRAAAYARGILSVGGLLVPPAG